MRKSHPTWVRGLKHFGRNEFGDAVKSHPTWVRGLKLHTDQQGDVGRGVAPYVGAWIETLNIIITDMARYVAPYVGAWIETPYKEAILSSAESHPTWVRGLKQEFHFRIRHTI